MKSITMASTGHEKEKLTVMLAAMADGTKLLPMVILKGVRRHPCRHRCRHDAQIMGQRRDHTEVATTGLATGQPAAKATCLGCLPGAHD